MGQFVAITGIAAWILASAPAPLAAAPQSAEVLQAQFDRESDLRDRARIAMKLLDLQLEHLRDFISTGTIIQPDNPQLADYLKALQQVETSTLKAAHVGTSKDVEKDLHRHLLGFEDLIIAVSADERPILQPVVDRVLEVREEILYEIMFPKEED